MDAAEAREMLRVADGFSPLPETWYDLGAGAGTFTLALAEWLAPGSAICAVDRDARSLKRIPDRHRNAAIRTIAADFGKDGFEWPAADGFLMANSLHFVRQQAALLAKTAQSARRLLIVEYEGGRASLWRPYPLTFSKLRPMLAGAGYTRVERLAERPSKFGGRLYSLVAER